MSHHVTFCPLFYIASKKLEISFWSVQWFPLSCNEKMFWHLTFYLQMKLSSLHKFARLRWTPKKYNDVWFSLSETFLDIAHAAFDFLKIRLRGSTNEGMFAFHQCWFTCVFFSLPQRITFCRVKSFKKKSAAFESE